MSDGHLSGTLSWGSIVPHTHNEAEINGLVADLAGKAALVHTHATSDVTGLDAALLTKALISETGNKLALVLDNTTYKLYAQLYDKNNNLINTSNEIDLPIEELVVSVAFDSETNELIITLKSGAVTRIPISSIISGLATQNWVAANYSPAGHAHDERYYTETEADALLADKADVGDSYTKTEEDTLLATKAAVSHSHVIADTTGLQDALDDKADTEDIPTKVSELTNDEGYLNTSGVNGLIATHNAATDAHSAQFAAKADATHSHAISDTTGLQSALDGKAAVTHSHAESDITGLQADLASKQDTISDLATIRSNAATGAGLASDVAANTAARHTHSNKAVLDDITESVPDIIYHEAVPSDKRSELSKRDFYNGLYAATAPSHEVGEDVYFNYVSTLAVSFSNAGLSASVTDEYKFAKAVGMCEQRDFITLYNGSDWTYEGEAISDFGITISGTPVSGDTMTVTMTVTKVPFTIVSRRQTGTNATVPADEYIDDWYIVERKYNEASQAFDAPESALCVTPGHTLPAGKYYVYNVAGATSDYWCNYKRLYYCFEIANDIVATAATGDITARYSSRGSRETTGDARGVYQLYCQWYCEATGARYNSDTLEFVGQVAAPSSDYTDIRTLTGFSTDQRMEIDSDDRAIIYNNLGHVCYGNNEWDVSNVCQRLNSDAKRMVPVRQHKNDVVTGLANVKGFLWGLDPRVAITAARTYQEHALSDEFTQQAIYSCEQDGFLLSMKEMSFNIQTDEGVAMELYDEYTGGTLTNNAVAARAKADSAGASPSSYRWSRVSYYDSSSISRIVSPAGAYDHGNANSGNRVAPAYIVTNL